MIYIDRSKQAVPDVLKGNDSRGQKETNKAIAHYSTGTKETFKYSVYSDSTVKEALIELFQDKCAYCESKFLHVYSGDIEHFRPKGEIAEEIDSKPGYYWLAADWDNLLLSCRNCNQKLKHLIHGATEKKTLGKMNQFPLSDPTKRVRKHDDAQGIKKEESYRLLIDPCKEDPEEYLEYDVNHALIKPKKINGQVSEKGKKSIEVYVLQRVPLVQARQRVLTDVLAQIQRVKEAVKDVSDCLDQGMDIKFYYDKILQRELARLKEYTLSTQEYSAMCKQVVGDFLKINFGIIL